MRLLAATRVHFVGIGGAGMSAIAKILLERGRIITGSDLKTSRTVSALQTAGAQVTIGHRGDSVDGAELVVRSAAIRPSNLELVRAEELGIPVITRGQALAELLAEATSVVVAGTHGKTTTTSMIVAILDVAGLDATYLIGGGLNDAGTNAAAGAGDVVVAEADESDGSFLLLRPHVAVVTNIEVDHVDHWASLGDLECAFATFMESVDPAGAVVIPSTDTRVLELAGSTSARVMTFGRGGDVGADDVALRPDGARFELVAGAQRADVNLAVPGLHNVENALAAAAACLAIGIEIDVVAKGLGGYGGVERRWEAKGQAAGITVVDDYAHHPTEVSATLAAARAGAWQRIVAVFQPHRYSRTAALHAEFGPAFDSADVVVVTDVYGAGEDPVPGITGKLIAEAAARARPGRRVAYLPHRDELVRYLEGSCRDGDLVLTLGAGDISSFGDELLARMRAR